MNISRPLVPLRPVDTAALCALLPSPDDPLWRQGDFRNEDLATTSHASTRNLVRRHEWFNRDGVPEQSLDEAVAQWAEGAGVPYDFAPCQRVATTSLCSVYEFPITPDLDRALDRCVQECIAGFYDGGGVVLRTMVTALAPGSVVDRHRDSGLTARFAHRIHIPLAGNEDVVYHIGAYKLRMEQGMAYEFNNAWRHSVHHDGAARWRINLIVDYLEDPTVPNPWRRYGWRP